MFLKPYKLKSNAPLKSSDTKRLRQRLEAEFPEATEEQRQELIPSKSSVSILKLATHSNFLTNVFCVDRQPMFFEIEGGALAPTLYALWQVSELLPYFTTHPDVLPKLSNGADLMLPGVLPMGKGMNMYGRYRKGQLVAINMTSNKSAIGVGILPKSSDDLYMCGGRGSAVTMLHLFGDKLWGHEPALAQQVPNMKAPDLTRDDFPELGIETKRRGKQQAAGEESTSQSLAGIVSQSNNGELSTIIPDMQEIELDEQLNSGNDATPLAPTSDEETPEIALKRSFLAALKNHGRTLQLPLLTSNFYRLYVVPEAAEPIDLKKTKYKKLSNFLNEMVDQAFIVVREESKGVDKITAIHLDHPELVNFITDFKPQSVNTDADGQEQPLFHSELTELYIVTDATAAFFTKLNYKRGEGIPATQIKKIIREYISQHNLRLADPVSKTVQLDETLRHICLCDAAPVSQICNAVVGKMEHSYQMCSVKDTASQKPLIQMSLATRSGNKKVTLVSNVECYGIIVPEFIKLCKMGAAASTNIVKLPHQKTSQIQIQGNQVRFVYTLLVETYKVPPKCILGIELAKDAKKYKKK